ncbi:hypothetical protein MPN29_02585 [Riemerella anatipestifer]|uniref:hypothetical protein n=1 Tax=Riemerella anatipestifer TaxID=34085 RepID=UPI0007ECE14F|nr:hypothetical protein [Riemerella anatipestifer]MDD1549105.1 hypothetical protein [Riemerella anatipestifer]MDR7831927.1 hypothetical protein [Riemerella anatipestifer]OBP62820.1 hypothetical protein AWB84_06855 [Riemerella anatipestifer]QZO83727.1 hypothetical protein K6T40_02580 [Riemerella anatipestifer]WKV54605.1 hypothetical protein MPN29_02585 [Riemerella anatipestifer]
MEKVKRKFAEFVTKTASLVTNDMPKGACVFFVSSLEKCSGFSNIVKGEGIKIAATLGVAFSQNPELAELVRMALESYDRLEKK